MNRVALHLVILLPALFFATAASAVAGSSSIQFWPADVPNAPGVDAAGLPMLHSFLPSATQNTGAGILIVPGAPGWGASGDREAAPLAQWLNTRGVAAFILSYVDGAPLHADADIAEVKRALQYLGAHATDFHLSAKRIGLLGLGYGGAIAAPAAFLDSSSPNFDSTDPVARASFHPAFLALIYGASNPDGSNTLPPPTFLICSTNAREKSASVIDLWNFLRSPRVRVPVEAHFFSEAEANDGIVPGNPSLGVWPELFYNWLHAYGFLTDQPRVAIHGSVSLDGRPLPHGYVIFTPLDQIGAGPIVAHVYNSTQGVAIGSFSVPANLGPVPGRYRVDVRQDANRWLSNTFSASLVRDPAYGHSRNLAPSIDDQHSFTKVHPNDKDDIIVNISPDGNPDLNITVFSQ